MTRTCENCRHAKFFEKPTAPVSTKIRFLFWEWEDVDIFEYDNFSDNTYRYNERIICRQNSNYNERNKSDWCGQFKPKRGAR